MKVSGLPTRIAALDAVLNMIIDRVEALPKPLDAEGRKAATKVGSSPLTGEEVQNVARET